MSQRTPTIVDPTTPFDSTTTRRKLVDPRETQASDPPTALVPRDNFRELPSGSVVGEIYEIDAKLGNGAMGEVYAARHQKLGKRVAIKVIGKSLSEDEAAIERFAMEARTLAQIQHPSIVAVDHVGELPDGRLFFVMEYLRGEPLFERISRGRVPLPEALRILDQMARGLDAAHGQGIIHRDLKPENTFLVQLPDELPVVKILDFGLAKIGAKSKEKDLRAERTQSGVAIGTPMYMSPEQCRGPDVDHRTDIYALGCVAYELFLGRSPFHHARTAPELFAAHLHETPPLPRSIWPEIPHQLDLILFAMLAKDPAYRPTLAQIRSVLSDVRMGTRAQHAPTEFVEARMPRQSSRSLTIAAIVTAALIGGITIGATLRPHAAGAAMQDASSPTITLPLTAPPDASAIAPLTPLMRSVPGPRLDIPPPSIPISATTPTTKPRPIQKYAPVQAPVAPPDAGVAARVEELPLPAEHPIEHPVPTPDTPIDRNRIVNPFAKKLKALP